MALKRRFFAGGVSIIAAVLALNGGPAGPTTAGSGVDLIFVNGLIMDGSGNPRFTGDVAVKDGRIAAVGRLRGKVPARRVIDIGGRILCPGFIDQHTHAYDPVAGPDSWTGPEEIRFAAPNFVSQGVTTVVSNLCGYGPVSLGTQIETLTKKGTGPNALLMIGHNSIRRAVMGADFRRAATAGETAKMADLVRAAMTDGAFGLSSGLEYVPAIWSTPGEIEALVREIEPFDGVYMAHERASGLTPMWYVPSRDAPGPPNMIANIRELIGIGKSTKARIVASHLKARGADFWGAGPLLVRLINEARAQGVDIWADCYPYNTSGSDGNTVLLPPWYLEKAPGIAFDKGADPKTAAALEMDVEAALNWRGGAENIMVMDHPDRSYIGRTLADLARARGLSDVDMAVRLNAEGDPGLPGGARLRGFSLSEEDIETFYAQPWTATVSDASITLPADGPDIHARFYGTFPRRIRHYAMERKVTTVEDAVRSMTSLPALILGLRDRGRIQEGFAADIVVFDPERIRDKAAFADPHRPAEGIESVLVNGVFVVEDGRPTGARPGAVIRKGR